MSKNLVILCENMTCNTRKSPEGAGCRNAGVVYMFVWTCLLYFCEQIYGHTPILYKIQLIKKFCNYPVFTQRV